LTGVFNPKTASASANKPQRVTQVRRKQAIVALQMKRAVVWRFLQIIPTVVCKLRWGQMREQGAFRRRTDTLCA